MTAEPNFICPGAQKAATSTLHAILTQHPQVYLPDGKETHFFDDHYHERKNWYLERYFGDASSEPVVGEVCPRYMFIPEVPERIHATLGSQIKFVFILRDPVDRALSHYWMIPGETRGFEEAIEENLQKLGNEGKKVGACYVERGFYAEQIERFLTYFDRQNMYFVKFSDFVFETDVWIDEILTFLGVSTAEELETNLQKNPSTPKPKLERVREFLYQGVVPELVRALVPSQRARAWMRDARKRTVDWLGRFTGERATRPEVSAGLRSRLIDVYSEDIDRLERLSDLDLQDWRDVEESSSGQ